MTDISDPAGAGRSDRKKALRVVDDAYGAGRISAADRALRVAQVEAASTRGDLAMVVRDLVQPGPATPAPHATSPRPEVPASPPAAVPPTPGRVPAPPEAGGRPWPPPGYGEQRPPSRFGSGVVKWVVLGLALFFILPCLLGIVLFAIGLSTSSTFSSSGPEVDLRTPTDWNRFVTDLRSETGSTVVVSATVRDDRVVVELPGDSSGVTERRTWDGDWDDDAVTSSAPPRGVVDLGGLDAAVVTSLPDRAAAELGVVDGTTTTDISSGGITVAVAGQGDVRVVAYRLDGSPA